MILDANSIKTYPLGIHGTSWEKIQMFRDFMSMVRGNRLKVLTWCKASRMNLGEQVRRIA